MWYTKNVKKIFKELDSNIDGLNEQEVVKRLQKGKNVIPSKKRDSIFKIFFSQFKSPIILILLVAIVLSLIIGELGDSIFIMAVVLINSIIGTAQEFTAEKSAEKLQNMIKIIVDVKRNSKIVEIDSADLVPGDIVYLKSGDKIPADIRLFEFTNFTVDESILTGESIAREKSDDLYDKETSISDINNMAFAGTIVLTGRATGIVVETGGNTELGKIATHVITSEDEQSPLVKRINHFSSQLSMIFLIFILIISIVLYFKGYMIKEIFFSVVALTVSAIPEGLSTAMTIALSISSNRMAKKNVIVKKLNSVESLGSCTVIASDKTGTLTMNEQTAKLIVLPSGKEIKISGIGYNGDGKILYDEEDKLAVVDIVKNGFINNEAFLEKSDGKWNYYGDSIDIAFLSVNQKLEPQHKKNWVFNKIIEIPYESSNKYSAVYYEDNGSKYLTVKGSLETVLDLCNSMEVNGKKEKLDKDLIRKYNDHVSAEGYRVIALAKTKKNKMESKSKYDKDDLKSLTFIGLVCFVDPIREEVVSSVEECKKSGIKVYMVTGDHPLTAYHIAKKIGIVSSFDEVATGDDIQLKLNSGEDQFDEYVKDIKVFARVEPLQKLQIVNSLKRQGEFVAVTGDGVNDAPALKSANIGIAMGTGSDVIKEVGDMIIADDRFSTIVTGIKEGRVAYNNIRNVIYLLLSTGFSEIILFVLSIVFDLPMPLVAVQFLWLNLITNGIESNALAFEKFQKNVMEEKVRDPKEGIFNKLLIVENLLSAAFIGIVAFIFYLYMYKVLHLDIALVRTYLLLLMVFMEDIHIFNCRSESVSCFKIPLKDNWFVVSMVIVSIIVQLTAISIEPLGSLLKLVTVPLPNALMFLFLSVSLIILMEIFKLVYFKNKNR